MNFIRRLDRIRPITMPARPKKYRGMGVCVNTCIVNLTWWKRNHRLMYLWLWFSKWSV